jgi:hypothetical protein
VFINIEDRLFKALIEQLYMIKIENAIEAGAYGDILERSETTRAMMRMPIRFIYL